MRAPGRSARRPEFVTAGPPRTSRRRCCTSHNTLLSVAGWVDALAFRRRLERSVGFDTSGVRAGAQDRGVSAGPPSGAGAATGVRRGRGHRVGRGENGKDSHVGVGPDWVSDARDGRSLGHPSGGLYRRPQNDRTAQRATSVVAGSHLVILVHQGSDPTQPYPTSVIRQSVTLFPRLCAWVSETTLFGPAPGQSLGRISLP